MNTVILVNIFAIMLAYIAKYPRCQTALIYSFSPCGDKCTKIC